MVANTKGGTALLIVVSMLAGIGLYSLALNAGLIDTSIPYKQVPSDDYTVAPRVRK